MVDEAWPQYRCHKVVRAIKITNVSHFTDGGVLLDVEGDFKAVRADAGMVTRYMPVPGDYIVEYDSEGYRAISPARAFEEGYALMGQEPVHYEPQRPGAAASLRPGGFGGAGRQRVI